tara:strand:+ start:428 stop:1321 length:894 start_codon:yes stop_codon:yes gene_type:complete
MKIIIAGGTGSIGTSLVEQLKVDNEIIILTRSKDKVISKSIKQINYSENLNIWSHELEDSDVLINLVGERIDRKRWSKKQKKKILKSRLDSIDKLSKALNLIEHKPQLIINASAVGFYSYSYEMQNELNTFGNHFLSEVCHQWEAKAKKEFENKSQKLAIIRIGVVLDKKSGIIDKLQLIFKLGFGAILGNGKQVLPWIDMEDVVGAIKYIIEKKLSGPINLTAPAQDTNYTFSKILGKILRRPVFLFVPEFIVRILIGKMSVMVLGSLNINPKILLDSGYKFRYTNLYKSVEKNIN